MSDDLEVLDLDAERATRAAQREGKGQTLPIKFGGEHIAVLPPELPMDVLAPLRSLDGDLTLILRQALATSRGNADRFEATELVVDVLASNPALPMTALDTLTQVGKNLLTEEGFEALARQRPSAQDYAALIKGVFRFYGLSLGEASPSSNSSTDSGATSPGTSGTTSDSTPEASGTTREPTPSLEPATS